MPFFHFDLSHGPCVVFDPGRMSFEYPASASEATGYGTYHISKNIAVLGALDA
jgi:hypothetical protein